MSTFKSKNSLEDRKKESNRVLTNYPNKIPIICEKTKQSEKIPDIDKHKYLIPMDLTIGQFMFVIRKRMKLTPEMAIYIFIKGIIPPTSALISSLYNDYKDEDGFLYLEYSGENTFGYLTSNLHSEWMK
jgi:GABA(A) receptor-associated protein